MRAGLGLCLLLLLMCGGFLYGATHREEKQRRREARAAARAGAGGSPGPEGVSFEPSIRAIVDEEERVQGPPPRLFVLGELEKVRVCCFGRRSNRLNKHVH